MSIPKKILWCFACKALFVLLLLHSCSTDLDDIFTDPVEKFLGNWKCEEESEIYGPGYVFDVVITVNPDNSSEILIANFYHQGMNEKARALVTGNILTIMEQTICDDTIIIKGNGQYKDGEVRMEYTANDGADLDHVTARLFKP